MFPSFFCLLRECNVEVVLMMALLTQVRNEKARKYLGEMRKKSLVPFTQKFPNADPLALRLLQRLLAFDPKDRPTATEALADPYFKGLAKVEREPSCQPISKMEFEFERRRLTKDDIRELIYREILEYHPQLLKDNMNGSEGSSFLYPRFLLTSSFKTLNSLLVIFLADRLILIFAAPLVI